MAKRVRLRIEGMLEQGVQVTLEISDMGQPPFMEATGALPAAPTIVTALHHWQQQYHQTAQTTRIHVQQVRVRPNAATQLETLHQAEKALEQAFKNWLESAPFHPLDRQLREALQVQESVQLLLKTSDRRLHALPWHRWDFFERYPLAELAISTPAGRIPPQSLRSPGGVKILAILGDRQGIDTAADRQFLAQLPDAQVVFLIEPSRQDITDQLWEQSWDILFFAGHSQTEGHQGRIYLNPHESLTLAELKYGLRTAIAHGLQLAIFNSCDGFGLAMELEQVQIPQLIVMREPVPDPVAQAFLKYFLQAFSHQQPLYQAVRQGRERLQGLEDRYPCATWLPILFQNPAVVPPTWQSLQGESAPPASDRPSDAIPGEAPSPGMPPPPVRATPSRFKIGARILLTSLVMTGLCFGIRALGWLQPPELAAFDALLSLRPPEPPDPRLLVIVITDDDVRAQPEATRRGSLSDATLLQVLQRLQSHQPRAIGLDIYRDFAVQPQYPELVKQLQQSDRLVAVCKVGEVERQERGIAPPPELPLEQVAFSDLVLDADNTARRQLLAMTPPPDSRCVAPFALSLQLALRYLAAEKIALDYATPETWRLGKLTFHPLKAPVGGYQKMDDRGYQILLNYRASPSPAQGVRQVTLGQVLRGEVKPEAVQNRIVLIGTIAEGTNDTWLTPYHTPHGNQLAIPGVMLQAQLTSQLLSAVLDDRPLLTAWPVWLEGLWMLAWASLGAALAWGVRKPAYLGLALLAAIAAVWGTCLLLLIQTGIWVPLVPPILSLMASSISYRTWESRDHFILGDASRMTVL